MKKRLPLLLFLAFAAIFPNSCDEEKNEGDRIHSAVNEERETSAGESEGKPRILCINSYNPDFPWTRGIMEAIFSSYNLPWGESGEIVSGDSPVILNVHYMRTLRDQSPGNIESAVREARRIIDRWKPDVVIASDDNASKYLIAPYYINAPLPFVFCGVNWNADDYGFPADNITGMIEVTQAPKIVDELMPYARGSRIVFLRANANTSRKEADYLRQHLSNGFEAVLVSSYEEWKREFVQLQNDADILLTTYPSAMPDWDGDEESLKRFMLDNTTIPTGSWDVWMAENVLITIANAAGEQGEWAARTALEIAGGKKPGDIPITENVRGIYYINMDLAGKLAIKFPLELIEKSHMVNPE